MPNDYEKGFLLVLLHNALKNCRNIVNHGKGLGDLDAGKLIGAMNTYVQLTKELYAKLPLPASTSSDH